MLAALRADEFDVVLACTAPSPRGVPGADVAAGRRDLGCDEVVVHDTVERGLRSRDARRRRRRRDPRRRQLYVAGAARPALRKLPQLT